MVPSLVCISVLSPAEHYSCLLAFDSYIVSSRIVWSLWQRSYALFACLTSGLAHSLVTGNSNTSWCTELNQISLSCSSLVFSYFLTKLAQWCIYSRKQKYYWIDGWITHSCGKENRTRWRQVPCLGLLHRYAHIGTAILFASNSSRTAAAKVWFKINKSCNCASFPDFIIFLVLNET